AAGGRSRSRAAVHTSPRAPSARAWPARAWAGRHASGTPSRATGWWTCSAGCRCLRSRGGPPWGVLLKDATGLVGIAMHLRDQGRQVGKLFLVAQARDELDLDAPPVQVAIEIEQMRLEQRLHATDGGTGAEARDRRPRGAGVEPMHASGIDATQRRHLA